MKTNPDVLKGKYYLYNSITNILIFINLFINIKLIPMGDETRGISYLICFVFNTILWMTISGYGGIVNNIEKILKFKYKFNIKNTGNYLTNDNIESVMYLIALMFVNAYIWIISPLSLKQGFIITLISLLIPYLIFYLINNKYVKIIKYYSRQENIKNTYKYY